MGISLSREKADKPSSAKSLNSRRRHSSSVDPPGTHSPTPSKMNDRVQQTANTKNFIAHVKARNLDYPPCDRKRTIVINDKVSWNVDCPEYKPEYFTSERLTSEPRPPWSDVEDLKAGLPGSPIFNAMDGKINRMTYITPAEGVLLTQDNHYETDPKTGVPKNPMGRTGMTGRGVLGRWGPNHAADPIVTRWKLDSTGQKIKDREGRPIAQFIAVQRRDNKEWALPGGMVDAGEELSLTLKREFGEEALNSLQASEEEKVNIKEAINELFKHGKEVYRGYVDDPRNTDNSWMETVAMNFHDDDGTAVAKFKLHAGDDAQNVQWMDLSSELKLYASHIDFLHKTAHMLNASWEGCKPSYEDCPVAQKV